MSVAPALRAAYSTRGGDVVHASEWGHVALCGAAVRDTGEPWTDETTHKCRRCLAKLSAADKGLSLTFGALAPSLDEQLAGRGVTGVDFEHFQALADATVRLSIHGLLTEAEVDRARRRLVKLIAKAVRRARR